MDEHAAGFSKPEGASKKTAVARERKMAHFPRGLAASFGGNEFVVFPECAVDESEIAFVDGPFWKDDEPITAKRSRSEEHTSQLQSPPHLACRPLREKIKRN